MVLHRPIETTALIRPVNYSDLPIIRELITQINIADNIPGWPEYS
jgi:hypothetical protein